jgi:hypothetical protein
MKKNEKRMKKNLIIFSIYNYWDISWLFMTVNAVSSQLH